MEEREVRHSPECSFHFSFLGRAAGCEKGCLSLCEWRERGERLGSEALKVYFFFVKEEEIYLQVY